MSEQQVVSIEPHEGVILAVVQCESLGEGDTQRMQQTVAAAAAERRQLPVVLDLSRVRFVPSLSLGALVTLQQGCKQNGQRFVLASLQPAVRDSLALTRLDKLFDICDSVEEAVAHLTGSS